jgi:hypothetical protein
MITKNDCVILLTDIQTQTGENTTKYVKQVFQEPDISIDILKYINDKRQLELTKFYQKLRKSYNNKKSSLYINIVKEVTEPYDVLTTLSSLNLQILLFAKNLEDKAMFFKHARSDEITKVINNYFKTFDIQPCLKLMQLIKADLKICEFLDKKD